MEKSTQRLYGIIGLLSVVLLAVVFGGLFGRSALGGPVPPGRSEVGRYQLTPAGNSCNPDVFILDTKTGRCWHEGTPEGPWKEVTPNYAMPR